MIVVECVIEDCTATILLFRGIFLTLRCEGWKLPNLLLSSLCVSVFVWSGIVFCEAIIASCRSIASNLCFWSRLDQPKTWIYDLWLRESQIRTRVSFGSCFISSFEIDYLHFETLTLIARSTISNEYQLCLWSYLPSRKHNDFSSGNDGSKGLRQCSLVGIKPLFIIKLSFDWLWLSKIQPSKSAHHGGHSDVPPTDWYSRFARLQRRQKRRQSLPRHATRIQQWLSWLWVLVSGLSWLHFVSA